MGKLQIVLLSVGALAVSAASHAATVQGSLRYGGSAATSTFTTMRSGFAGAMNMTTSQITVGTVNLAANTYSIPGLSPAQYSVFVRESPSASAADGLYLAGDLYGWADVTISAEGTITQDLDLLSAFHVTQPLDNAAVWQGSTTVCPQGPIVPTTFTLAWDPVPRAASYGVRVDRWDCASGLVGRENLSPSGTSVQIAQRAAAGEEFIVIWVEAHDAVGRSLAIMPNVNYTSGYTNGHYFHAAGTQAGRPVHPTNSRFLAQVAHLAGQPPTFWRTDLFLANPTSTPVAANLRFTPRDSDGTQNYIEAQVDLPARAARTITDVLDTLFHTSGAGSLEVEPAALEVACRNYTPGAGPGLYGQGFLPISADQVAWVGGPTSRIGTGGVAKGAYRANLSLTEVWGENVAVRVWLLDRDGSTMGWKDVSLPPFGTTQINDVVAKLGGPASIAEAQVEVVAVSGAGRVGAVLSLVDNGSQDPSTLPLGRRQ